MEMEGILCSFFMRQVCRIQNFGRRENIKTIDKHIGGLVLILMMWIACLEGKETASSINELQFWNAAVNIHIQVNSLFIIQRPKNLLTASGDCINKDLNSRNYFNFTPGLKSVTSAKGSLPCWPTIQNSTPNNEWNTLNVSFKGKHINIWYAHRHS